MATYIAGKIISEIGISALIGTASTVTSTTSSVYGLLYKIARYSGPGRTQIINSIFELDIENSIRIIDSLLREIPKDKIKSLPVIQSIDSLNEIIKTISGELKVIYERLNYNESLWIAGYWRSYDCSKNIKRLKVYNEILEKRRKILFDVLQIKHEITDKIEQPQLLFNANIGNDVIKYLNSIQKNPLNSNIIETKNIYLDDTEKKIENNIIIKDNIF
jgi:hypothetical protein